MKPNPPALRSVGGALLLCLVLAGVSSAGPIYSWSWAPGDAGVVNNGAGVINSVAGEFDTDTEVLSWYVNLQPLVAPPPDQTGFYGMTLTLTDGAVPLSSPGELAILYLDGSWSEQTLTGFGYNGLPTTTSHRDGSAAPGLQTPDRIASSLHAGSDAWDYHHAIVEEADGSLTMGFHIDASIFNLHTPLYPDAGGWHGIGFGEQIGVNLKTFYRLGSNYENGFPADWVYITEGGLSVSNAATQATDPIPEPASLTLFGLGLGAWGLIHRRRHRS